jgi:hypothetical protein
MAWAGSGAAAGRQPHPTPMLLVVNPHMVHTPQATFEQTDKQKKNSKKSDIERVFIDIQYTDHLRNLLRDALPVSVPMVSQRVISPCTPCHS